MNAVVVNATRAVNPDMPLIVLAGLLAVRFVPGDVEWLHLAGRAVSLMVRIVVFGPVTARVSGMQHRPAIGILKNYGPNYLLVLILLFVPVFVFEQMLKLVSLSF